LPDIAFNPEQYLRVRITALEGALDTEEEVFRHSEQISTQQGKHRLERARRWVAAMKAQAQAHAMPAMVDLIEIDGVDHHFGPLCREGRLIQRVFWLLFGATVDEESTTTLTQ
jgi:hypothetical protein